MMQPRALHVHIPKSGGTSVYHAFPESVALLDPQGSIQQGNARARWNDKRVVVAHYAYQPWMRRYFTFVSTILRNPVMRIYSLYGHAHGHTRHELHAAACEGLRAFVEHRHPQVTEWATRQLSGMYRGTDKMKPDAYVQARAHLFTFNAVHAYHYMRRSIERAVLCIAEGVGLGGRRDVGHHRATAKYAPEPLTAEIAGIIMARNPYDCALFKEFCVA